ncbi:trypsin delta-like [Drosophila biarmipes]|uniref:trypsin delta-like n=1 Tax=Drosophila biarmipes TaxID=125945 RepID=UPI0007E7C7A1|nr:trypsin delta-like [Drosophila biarmipes]
MFRSLVLLHILGLAWLVLGDQRIINGNTVNIKDAPWYASILVRSYLKCGGVLVSNNYILTAAKCVDGYNVKNIKVRIGTNSCRSGGSQLGICSVKIHSQYSSLRFDNNLALLKTCELLKASDEIKPIERIDKLPADNSQAKITGCGARSGSWFDVLQEKRSFGIFDGINNLLANLPAELHGTEVKILGQKQCAADWTFPFLLHDGISELTICTKSSGTGACSFDMGAPLVVDNKLVGILSRAGCTIKPDVFSNILKHANWLDSNIKQ